MFNILTEKLPEYIVVNGEKCHIKTGFRNWIVYEIIVGNPNLTDEQKIALVLPLCLKKLPSSIETAVKACNEFYCGSREKKMEQVENQSPLYSFLFDAELIYAAFMSQYGIDLNKADMHWFKFRALFKGLSSNNRIFEVMKVRAANLNDIKDVEQRRRVRELKKVWKIPTRKSENDIVRAVEGLC